MFWPYKETPFGMEDFPDLFFNFSIKEYNPVLKNGCEEHGENSVKGNNEHSVLR